MKNQRGNGATEHWSYEAIGKWSNILRVHSAPYPSISYRQYRWEFLSGQDINSGRSVQGLLITLDPLNLLEFWHQEMHYGPGYEIGKCAKYKNDGVGDGHIPLNDRYL
ncbi:MAG: hypothetical protein H6Q21_1186 [Bacteroidetes bacterium]|nr:hypothetical protein [Bacteroidota bacterium]